MCIYKTHLTFSGIKRPWQWMENYPGIYTDGYFMYITIYIDICLNSEFYITQSHLYIQWFLRIFRHSVQDQGKSLWEQKSINGCQFACVYIQGKKL